MARTPRSKRKPPESSNDELDVAVTDPKDSEGDITRQTELAHDRGQEGDKLRDKLVERYAEIEQGFIGQGPRSDDQLDYWDCYNCALGGHQAYAGNAQIYVPIIHNAVNARATRFTNQLFPKGGRYIEVVTSDGEQPHAVTALLEHYVRKAKLRTEVAFPLCVNGDIEGQYSVYVAWNTLARHAVWKEKKPLEVLGAELKGIDEVDDIVEDVILDEFPTVEVLADADLLILPVSANSVPEALAAGGSVTVIRRYTKAQLEQMAEDGDLVDSEVDALLNQSSDLQQSSANNPQKAHADAAGVRSAGKSAVVYESWMRLRIGDETRLCVVKYGGNKVVLSCRLNPYWSDRCPIISASVKKVAGVFKGISQVEPCTALQYAANDAVNEGMDSATYALLPIIMTDPAKNPKVNTMILDLAAVWETSPNDTQFAKFPELWKGAFEIVAACKSEIFQTLSVNPAMMPQSTGGRHKRNQAEIAQEQQVDIMTTSDAVTVLEEGIFTEIVQRFAEMDAQFRQEKVSVRAYGYMGLQASMESVPPLQLGTRYNFVWYGVEQARNVAQIQQQIALLNVVRGIPPQMLPGRRINMVPAIEHAMAAAFGPRIAPLVFEDVTKQFSVDPEIENDLLLTGQNWPVSPLDDDALHIEAHAQAAQAGDPSGALRQHIAYHRIAQVQKAQAQQQAQSGEQPGTPGTPGGPPQQPGIAGTPRPGGQVAGPRLIKQAAGAISPDQLPAAGAVVPPRRT